MSSTNDALHLERHDPARNMARYYTLSVESDLFNAVLAVRRWGRVGTVGRQMSIPCPDRDAAVAALGVAAAAKRRRGYVEASR